MDLKSGGQQTRIGRTDMPQYIFIGYSSKRDVHGRRLDCCTAATNAEAKSSFLKKYANGEYLENSVEPFYDFAIFKEVPISTRLRKNTEEKLIKNIQEYLIDYQETEESIETNKLINSIQQANKRQRSKIRKIVRDWNHSAPNT